MVLVINFVTIYRLAKMKRRYPEVFEKAKEPGA
jgi:sugar (pentulose or hexulose) kinase